MAYPTSNLDQYRKSAVITASPLQLVIMLYDGAMKNLNAGKRAMLEHNTFEQNNSIIKAQKIIAELISCLDMKQGGEIATNLLSLYSYCYSSLLQSNVEDKPELIDQVILILSNLRSSWVELDKATKVSATAQNEAA